MATVSIPLPADGVNEISQMAQKRGFAIVGGAYWHPFWRHAIAYGDRASDDGPAGHVFAGELTAIE